MLESTVLVAFANWVINGVSTGIVANLTYDGLKEIKVKLHNKLKEKFVNEDEVNKFINEISTGNVINVTKPYRDIEDAYEKVTGRDIPIDFIDILKQLVNDNKEVFTQSNVTMNNLHIERQEAERDIYNIQGNPIINNNGDSSGKE